jgi:hypothetical protein
MVTELYAFLDFKIRFLCENVECYQDCLHSICNTFDKRACLTWVGQRRALA